MLLREAVEVSRPMITEKRHELSLALAPEPLALDADPTRLLQVFANLINNAAKYTDADGHIAIVSAVENGEAVVTVRDDGIGMTPDLLARAFDLFAAGDARSRSRAGWPRNRPHDGADAGQDARRDRCRRSARARAAGASSW